MTASFRRTFSQNRPLTITLGLWLVVVGLLAGLSIPLTPLSRASQK